MDKLIKRIVLKLFPELTARYHLPLFALVVAVRETPTEGVVCDEFRPYYAIDIQLLDEHGKQDLTFPVLKDVPLTLPVIGQEMGVFAYPEVGVRVEVAFAYGSPNSPFIRSILPNGMSLPGVELGEQRWQHNPASFQRVDKSGNWETQTDLNIIQDSLKRLISCATNLETYAESTKDVDGDDKETIGGSKKIKAMGSITESSGGRFDMSAKGDMNVSSKSKNKIKAPKTWIGSSGENVLQLLSEHLLLTIQLCTILKDHTHSGVQSGTSSTDKPDQENEIQTVGTDTTLVNGRLVVIKE